MALRMLPCLARNGVAHVAALEAGELAVELHKQVVDHAGHELVGVGTALVDLQTGMPATKALEGEATGHKTCGRRFFLIRKVCSDVDATGATDVDLALLLGVEVEQNLAGEFAGGQVERAVHACLLIAGDKGFQWPVLQVLGLEDGHDDSHAQAIVGAQRGAASTEPVAIDPSLDGVAGEVVHGVARLLRHHVHVGLKDHALAVLHARSGGLANEHVTRRVNLRLQAKALAKIDEKLRDLLHVSRRTGNLGQRVEMTPHALRGKFEYIHIVNNC